MKKIFTILCVSLLSVGVFAQAETEAGTFLLSGATGLDFASTGITGTDPSDAWNDDNKQSASNMNLKLMGGYFVADGFAIGLSVGYDTQTSKQEAKTDETFSGYRYVYESSYKSTTSTMIIAPTVRYYFGESGVWLQTSYGFGSMSEKDESDYSESQTEVSTGNVLYSDSDSDSDSDSNPMSILTFGAGYAISLSDNISLNPSVGYAMSSVTIEDGYTNSSGNDEDLKINSSGMTFNLGIALHLGR
jgi:hypothetical protein